MDHDAELLKVSLLSDEIRTRHFAVIGMWIAFLIALVAGDVSLLSLNDKLIQLVFVGGFFVAAFYIALQIRGASLKYLKRISQLSDLIKSIEGGTGLGEFKGLLKKFIDRPELLE